MFFILDVALCPNNDKILILDTKAGMEKSKWKLVSVLKQHQEIVLVINWHASNTIASGGLDHNVYIWTQQDNGTWKPSLVILQ